MDKKLKNSEDFITQLTGKKTGFTTPKDYFNTLEDEIITANKTHQFERETGFVAPEKYFENFEEQIFSKLSTSKKEVKVISLQQQLLKLIPYAAAAVLILFIGLNALSFDFDNTKNTLKLSDTEIENWFNTTTLDTEDMAVVLQDLILEENSFSMTNLKDESIEDYILSKDETYLYNEIY